jgi:hypothetical protein
MQPEREGIRRYLAHATWSWRRLQMMSVGEVAVRVRHRILFAMWRRRRTWPTPTFLRRPSPGAYRLRATRDHDGAQAVIDQAEDLLAGRLVALDQTFSIESVDWHHDPQSGITTPLRFGPTLDYRDPQIAGNARNIWELNRHQYLTTIALAHALTGEERFATFVGRQLESWVDQNPFPLGINWTSPLELGLRLISWVWISRFLAGSAEAESLFGDRGRLWPAIYRHQWMIDELHSRGSSANNHLVGEMAGLYMAAVEWPLFPDSQEWERSARRRLHEECARQFYDSGVHREQAFGYHLFTTELFELAALEGERSGRPFADEYRARLRRAVAASETLIGPRRLQPNFGDSDDGQAVGLPGGGGKVPDRLATVIAHWLDEIDPRPAPPSDCQLAAEILLSDLRTAYPPASAPSGRPPVTPTRSRAAPSVSPIGSRAFTDAGLFILASSDLRGDIVCLADAGELGYLNIAAHGHADALSFALTVDSEHLVVDPGTFAYHYDPEARAYFRGTRGHNTVTIDGLDQSVAAGPFLWTRKARVTVHEWSPTDNGARLVASHDGYERLTRPVTHKRTLILDAAGLTIADELAGTGVGAVEWRLHFAPDCRVHLGERTCEVAGTDHRVVLELAGPLEWRLAVGSDDGGWYSNRFNQRQEATTLIGSAQLNLPAHFEHTLQVVR